MADFLMINDPGGGLNGKLSVHVIVGSAGANGRDVHRSPSAISGGANAGQSPIVLESTRGAEVGRHPIDTFLRLSPAASGNAGNPGLCSDTLHPWRVRLGAFSNVQGANSGTLQATTAPALCLVPVTCGKQGGVSRLVEADFTDSAYTSGSGIVVHRSLTQPTNRIEVYFTGHLVQIAVNGSAINNSQVNGTNVVVTDTNTYTLGVALTISPSGVPTRVRVYLNGVKGNDYYLTAAQQTALAVTTDDIYPFLEDGLNMKSTTVQATGFRVRDFTTEEPYQRAGTTTLVAGTKTINDAHITATSVISLHRQAAGGTLGNLSVGTLTAGTSFIINSDNAADTSVVYYEVVSY